MPRVSIIAALLLLTSAGLFVWLSAWGPSQGSASANQPLQVWMCSKPQPQTVDAAFQKFLLAIEKGDEKQFWKLTTPQARNTIAFLTGKKQKASLAQAFGKDNREMLKNYNESATIHWQKKTVSAATVSLAQKSALTYLNYFLMKTSAGWKISSVQPGHHLHKQVPVVQFLKQKYLPGSPETTLQKAIRTVSNADTTSNFTRAEFATESAVSGLQMLDNVYTGNLLQKGYEGNAFYIHWVRSNATLAEARLKLGGRNSESSFTLQKGAAKWKLVDVGVPLD